MNIENLTLAQIREIQALSIGKLVGSRRVDMLEGQSPFKIGEKWLFRTVTHIDTGEIIAIHGPLITLTDAAWIADTGRYTDSLKDTSKFAEVEPYPGVCVVNVGALVDATPIGVLPTEQK